MASLKELTEDATTDRQDARSRSIGGRKNYTFHIFYQPSGRTGNHPYLQVLVKKLRKWTLRSEIRRMLWVVMRKMEMKDWLIYSFTPLKRKVKKHKDC